MREIKFRGLNAKGEFVYGFPLKDLPHSTAYYDDYSYRICWHPETGGSANCPVKNGTLGEFTGLKDRNGIEIYDADVIRCRMSFDNGSLPHAGEVVYNEEMGAFATRNFAGTTLFHNLQMHTLEVIGNVHENPELMEYAE